MASIDVKGKIVAFLDDSKRIFTISKKPTKDEFLAMVKVVGIGIIIIGVIGYLISLLFNGAVFPIQ